MTEKYVDIPGYEGLYQVSDHGNIRSRDKLVWNGYDYYLMKSRVLKQNFDGGGYPLVSLYKNKKQKTFRVHVLVAMAFLGHKMVGRDTHINHIDHDRTNNNLSNLEIVSARENLNKKHLNSTSKYTGVCWHKASNSWQSKIVVGKDHFYLGYFKDEIRAAIAYDFAVKQLDKIKTILKT